MDLIRYGPEIEYLFIETNRESGRENRKEGERG